MTNSPSILEVPHDAVDSEIFEDYIIIDESNGQDDEQSLESNDDSYDHCDDVFTNDEEDVDETGSLYSDPVEAQEHLILKVPSGLMKDLDEAHAAAKLAQIQEPDLVDEEEPEVLAAEEELTSPDIIPAGNDDSSLYQKTEISETAVEPKNSRKNKTRESVASNQPNNLSRASNKKRRKKLKLLKKAQAAASAANALSTKALASAATSKPKEKVLEKKLVAPTRGSSRKVSNVAVACARQSIAAYRKEMSYTAMSKQTC